MIQILEPNIVRIRSKAGSVVGGGVRLNERQILTCAHVIGHAAEIPVDEVLLDLPLVEPERILRAHIVHWDVESDIAALELIELPPTDTCSVRLVTTEDFWGHSFRAFGFPAGYERGVWTSGVLRGSVSGGWVQMEDVKEPGYWVQPGFSGTPVWDEQLNGIIGIAVAADADRVTKAAYMIPTTRLIKSLPELTDYSLEAGTLEHLQVRLDWLERAQRQAADPARFQMEIDALRERIATWNQRVERQRQRIADGLDAQRRQRFEDLSRRQEQKKLRVVGQRPLDVTDYFKDRQHEQVQLERLLKQPTTRLVSVIGHGGMGKTALACKVLQDLERNRWPTTDEDVPIDGIVYLSTRTDGISLERIFLDCAKLLEETKQKQLLTVWTNPNLGIKEKINHLLEAVRNGHYVILLDNLEDLLDGQGQFLDDDLKLFFDQAIPAVCDTQMIVTSRIALAFQRDVMRFDHQLKLQDGLPIEEGVKLLQELDPNGDYGLRNAPLEQLQAAVELTHGVPRALEVLAGILANDPFATLDEVLATFYAHEDVVQALIEENYQRLDQGSRRVVEALATFRKPVQPLAIDYLLEPFSPGLDVPNVLRRLNYTNIIQVDRSMKTVTLHPIDQDYAYSQLPEECKADSKYTRQALERRAADYYIHLRIPAGTWESIDDLEPQLLEFEHRVRAGDYDIACKVINAIERDYLFLWGHYRRIINMRTKLRRNLVEDELRTTNLGRLGRSYWVSGQLNKAIECHSRALRVARRIRDPELECEQLSGLGYAYHVKGDFEKAVDFSKDSLKLAKSTDNQRAQATQLRHLGDIYRSLGVIQQSMEYYNQALQIAQNIGNRRIESGAFAGLGLNNHVLGHLEEAIRFYKSAISIAREIGHRLGEGPWLGHLGRAYLDMGLTQQALRLFEESLVISRQLGDRRSESMKLSFMGKAYRALGNIQKAIQCHENALTIAREIGYRIGESFELLRLGRLFLSVGNITEARYNCQEAIDLEIIETKYQAYLILGIVMLHQNDPDAKSVFMKASKHSQELFGNNMYEPWYFHSAALIGQAVCNTSWDDRTQRDSLLAPALEEYRHALKITAAAGVVQSAIRDLELIQAAGIEGLEPVVKLLKNSKNQTNRLDNAVDVADNLI